MTRDKMFFSFFRISDDLKQRFWSQNRYYTQFSIYLYLFSVMPGHICFVRENTNIMLQKSFLEFMLKEEDGEKIQKEGWLRKTH